MASKLIGKIAKSDTAEVRITQSCYKGRSIVDVRVWYIPKDCQDYVPSRKGVTIDSSKMKDLINLLVNID